MKKIIIFLVTLCLFGVKSFTQSIVPIRGDTIRMYKQGDTAVAKVDSILFVTMQAVIGRNYSSLNASASLDLRDTTRAFKTNSMYSRLRITTPIDGMFIYEDSTEQFLGYVDGAWESFGGSGTDYNFAEDNLTQTGARIYAGATFDYTLNNLGNWTYNVNTDKAYEIYAGTYNFLSIGHSSSGSTFFANATTNGVNSTNLTLYSEGLDESEFANLSVIGTNFNGLLNIERDDGILLEMTKSGKTSNFQIQGDSISMKPFLGQFNIDSLRAGTSVDEVMTWNQGMVRKVSMSTFNQTLQDVILKNYYVHDTSVYFGQNFFIRWDYAGAGNPVGQLNWGTNSMAFFNIGSNNGVILDWRLITGGSLKEFRFRNSGQTLDTLATLYDIRTGGSIPTLQQVLDAGSTINTTESIILTGGSLFNFDIGANSYVSFTNSVASPQPVSIFSRVTDNTNSTNYVSRFDVFSTGTVANGFGGTIGYVLENASGGTRTANEFKWKFTNATAGSETSQIDIEGVDNGGGELFMNIQANGIVRVNDNADTLATKAYARSVGGGGGGGGTVTDFIFTDGNGFDGTVTNSTSTPTLSLTTTVGNTQVMFSNNGAVTGSSDFKYISADNSIELGTGDVVAGYTDAIAMEGSIARGVGAIVFSTNARDSSSNTFMGAGQNTIIRPSANGSATFMTDGVVYGGATYSFSANDANEIKGESASVFGFGNKISVQNGFLAGNTNNLGSLSGIGGLNSYTDSWMIGTNNESTGDRNGTLGYKIQNTGQEAIIIGMGIAAGNDLWNSVRRRFGVGFNSDSLTFIVGEASGAGTFGLTRIRGGLELGMPNNDNTNDRFLTIDATTNMVEWTSLGAFTDENFAENDLTATANRTHDFAGFDLQINDLGVTGFKTEVTGSAYGEIGLGGKVASYMAGMIANFDANDYATMGVNQGDGTSNAFIDASAGSNYSSINVTGSSIVLRSAAVNLGIAGSSLGVLKFNGNTSGTITIQSAAAAGTYTLTLPTTDGDVDQYLKTDGSGGLSWSTPAGSGTINSGTTGKPAYYVGATTLDDFIAVDYATSGNNVTITQNNTTDVALRITAASSSAEDLLRIVNNGGTNMLQFSENSELIIGNISDAGQYSVQTVNGYYADAIDISQSLLKGVISGAPTVTFGIGNNSGTQWDISTTNAPMNLQALGSAKHLYISTEQSNSYVRVRPAFSIMANFSTSGLTVGQDGVAARTFQILKTDAVTNAVTYLERQTYQSSGTVANGFGLGTEYELENASGTNRIVSTEEIIYTDATDASEDADYVLKLMAGGATAAEKFRVLSTGEIAVQLLNQDDAETRVVVWDNTSKKFEWRDASTLGGGSSTLAALTDVNLTSLATNDFLKWDGTDWINRTPANVRSDLSLVVGTNVQAWDADLDTWAGITPASGVGTWLGTPSSANLRGAVTDENGTGALLFDGATSPTFAGTISGNISGSAATLTTTRTIWGQNFNGSANVTGNLTIGTANLLDANGNEFIIFSTTASAVNEVTFANAATGNNPQWTASGGDANIGMNWLVKGTGLYRFLATTSGPTDIRLFEDADNGTNNVSLIAPSTLGADAVLTLPNTTGTIPVMSQIKQAKSATISAPTASENLSLFYTTQAITIEEVRGVMLGTSQSVTLVINYGDTRDAADGTVVASIQFDSGETGYQTTGFAFTINTANIPAGNYIWLTTSATSGTVNDLNLTLTYRQQ